jgi:hypothetical protein
MKTTFMKTFLFGSQNLNAVSKLHEKFKKDFLLRFDIFQRLDVFVHEL